MEMKKYLIILGIVCILLLNLSGCQEKPEIHLEYDENTLNSHFGFMHPMHLIELPNLGVFWQRPHPGPFIWNEIEREPGKFDWSSTDEIVKQSQQYGINILATIWPFADWDQKNCNKKLSTFQYQEFPQLGKYRGKPCDITAYQNFIETLVERYDGDGIDDMPGLLYPIKYWEVSNEPSMQDDLIFFTGSPEDYYNILVATYNGVKNADSSSFVVLGGMAGLSSDMKEFWDRVFDMGADNYFDIANIHSIGTDSEDAYALEYSTYLKENNISKPFWITEVELLANPLNLNNPTSSDWAKIIVKIFVKAFAGGADKLFYIGLEECPGDEGSWLIKEPWLRGVKKQAPYYAFQTMVNKIDYFDSVEKLDDDQYKFTIDDKIVYVLWGSGDIPSEITGEVIVTSINGDEQTLDASEVELSDSPIFLETTT